MTFFLLSGLAVGAPFVIERFYLKHRFGIFALLFWVFALQVGILAFAFLLADRDLGVGGTLEGIGAFVAGTAFLTIGLTPLAAVALALVFTAVRGFARISSR